MGILHRAIVGTKLYKASKVVGRWPDIRMYSKHVVYYYYYIKNIFYNILLLYFKNYTLIVS